MSDATRSVQARLASIDFHLLHLRKVTRREHMQRFDISSASASKDLSLYMQFLAPGMVAYDTKSRTYIAGDSFEQVYQQPSSMNLDIWGKYFTPEEMLAFHRMLTARIGIPQYSVEVTE